MLCLREASHRPVLQVGWASLATGRASAPGVPPSTLSLWREVAVSQVDAEQEVDEHAFTTPHPRFPNPPPPGFSPGHGLLQSLLGLPSAHGALLSL